MGWFKRKETCIHCNTNKTRRDFEEQPTCPACRIDILIKRETPRVCPADGVTLVKTISNEIIIDQCPTCKGVWLDAGELEAIKQAATEEGMGTGMVLGIAT